MAPHHDPLHQHASANTQPCRSLALTDPPPPSLPSRCSTRRWPAVGPRASTSRSCRPTWPRSRSSTPSGTTTSHACRPTNPLPHARTHVQPLCLTSCRASSHYSIPPYFALIIRAIGVLEGIALVGNPQFAIVDEAYPYISKRLLTDDTPRLRAALRYMIYGRENVFDVDRLIDLLQAFETLEAVRATKTGATAPIRTAAPTDPNSANSVRDALRFFFSPEGEWAGQ